LLSALAKRQLPLSGRARVRRLLDRGGVLGARRAQLRLQFRDALRDPPGRALPTPAAGARDDL